MNEFNTVDTAKRFGYQWKKYAKVYRIQELQFLRWIHPFRRESFEGKDVCDAGCGMGRNSRWVAQYGVNSIVAFDNTAEAVASARELLRDFPNVRVERQNIYDIPYRECFDICFSIGVLHHLEHPDKAMEVLANSLKSGGKFVVWLYAYEGNENYVRCFRYLHPLLRKVSPALLSLIAYSLAILLYLYLKFFTPRSLYLQSISEFPLSHLHLIILDQLVPEIARYYTRKEVESLFSKYPWSELQIYHNQNYSWTVIATKAKQ